MGICLNRILVVLLIWGAFCGNSFAQADSLSLNSVMDLFVEDYQESAEETESKKRLEQMGAAILLHDSARSAMYEKRYDDFKRIYAETQEFEKKYPYRVFYDADILVVKYFAKDFAFLCNVDSVARYKMFVSPQYGLGATNLREQMESGVFEETLKEIENGSDRAFVRILFTGLFEDKETVSKKIAEDRSKLTNQKQLKYLVDQYWSMREPDLHNFATFSFGLPFSKLFGDLEKKVKPGFGGITGIDMLYKDFLLGWNLDAYSGKYRDVDSLYFFDANVGFNLGYMFLSKRRVHLYGFLSVGIGIGQLACDDYDDEKCNDDSRQDYFTYGAGGMADVLFARLGNYWYGIRLRGGMRNVKADHLVDASGYRLGGSIELVMLRYKEKNVEFEFKNGGGAAK